MSLPRISILPVRKLLNAESTCSALEWMSHISSWIHLSWRDTGSLANRPTANLFEQSYLSDFQMDVNLFELVAHKLFFEFFSITESPPIFTIFHPKISTVELWTNSFATQITIGRGVEGETPAFWTRPQRVWSTMSTLEVGVCRDGLTKKNTWLYSKSTCIIFSFLYQQFIIPLSQTILLTLGCQACGTGNIQ